MALTFKPNESQNGGRNLVISAEDLPQFLIDAKVAIEHGRINEAGQILNDQALADLSERLEKDPPRTDAMFMVGLMLDRIGQLGKAEEWYRKLLQIEPNAVAWHKLGLICQSTGRISEAIGYRKKALEAEPDNTLFQISLALDTIRQGKTQEGVELLRKIVEKDPGNADAHSKLLFHMHFMPELDQPTLFDEHLRWGRTHAPLSRARTTHENTPEPDRRLRIGYLSPDFRIHATVYNFAPLVDAHNRKLVEVYGYGNVSKPDSFTEYLEQKFDRYRSVYGM
ncbi:MAG: tetratricopeptide repeat protein, partial [Planctomycetota bacterium]